MNSSKLRGKTWETQQENAAASSGYEVLYSFGSTATDGERPSSSLIQDAEGNICSTTVVGGTGNNAGTVFKVDAEGHETVVIRQNSVRV